MILKITTPDDGIDHSFTSLKEACKFCEKEFGYGRTVEIDIWKEIKKTSSLEILKDFLWHEGLWVELHNG